MLQDFLKYCSSVKQLRLITASALCVLTACGPGLKPEGYKSPSSLSEDLVPIGQKFALLDTQAVTSTLGTSRILTARIVAAHDFAGSVALSIQRTTLDAIDTNGDIVITPVPNQVALNPSEVKTVSFSVEIRTRSPSFTNSSFNIVATEVTTAATKAEIQIQIPITVQAVYEILMVGGSPPEVWSSPPSASFLSHASGLKVRFINMDLTRSHAIHGTGVVPTQTGSLAPATATGPGGGYEVTILPSAGAVSATYYCDTHEVPGDAHTLNFNQP